METDSNIAKQSRAEITELIERYATAIDARDAEAYRSCFAEQVRIDSAGNPTLETTGEDWTAQAMRAIGVFERTEHRISNVEIDLTGGTARYKANVEARHWNADVELIVLAAYSHEVSKSEEGWRIQHFVMEVIETKAVPIP